MNKSMFDQLEIPGLVLLNYSQKKSHKSETVRLWPTAWLPSRGLIEPIGPHSFIALNGQCYFKCHPSSGFQLFSVTYFLQFPHQIRMVPFSVLNFLLPTNIIAPFEESCFTMGLLHVGHTRKTILDPIPNPPWKNAIYRHKDCLSTLFLVAAND